MRHPTTMLEQMLAVNPVHLERRKDGYHCTWIQNDGTMYHARGVSDTAGGAIYQAWKHATDNGWAKS